jgi:hypothetical protein
MACDGIGQGGLFFDNTDIRPMGIFCLLGKCMKKILQMD